MLAVKHAWGGGMSRMPRAGHDADERAAPDKTAMHEQSVWPPHSTQSSKERRLFQMLQTHLSAAFSTELRGMPVTFETIAMTDDNEIVVVCVRMSGS